MIPPLCMLKIRRGNLYNSRNMAKSKRKSKRPARTTKPDSTKRAKFLRAYASCGTITHAAEAAGVHRATHYEWLDDPGYAVAFDQANAEAVERLEAEARRRAVDGCRRYKFHQGLPVLIHCDKSDPEAFKVTNDAGKDAWVKHYYELEYSDSLLLALLKARDPERFRERSEQRLTGELNLNGKAQVVLDDDWYDNAYRLPAPPAAPPDPGPAE